MDSTVSSVASSSTAAAASVIEVLPSREEAYATLLQGLEQAKAQGAVVSDGLMSGLQAAQATGAPLGAHAAQELRGLASVLGGYVHEAGEGAEGGMQSLARAVRTALPTYTDVTHAFDQAATAGAATAGLVGGVGELGSKLDSLGHAVKDHLNWGEVDQVYCASRDQVMAGVALAVGLSREAFAFIHLEVFRDIYQQLSVIFSTITSSEALRSAKHVFGNLSSIVNINFNYVFNIPVTTMLIILTVLGVAFLVAVLCLPCFLSSTGKETDEIRDGHEAVTWQAKKDRHRRTVTTINLLFTGIITLYLPISQIALECVTCSSSFGLALQYAFRKNKAPICHDDNNIGVSVCRCGAIKGYGGMVFFAVVALILISVWFPIYCFRLIQSNKPVGSLEDKHKRYNDKGELVVYSDRMYAEDLKSPKQQACPFLFLYKDYDRKFAYWKIAVMGFKAALVLVTVSLERYPIPQNVVALALQTSFAYATYRSAPFIRPTADTMDTTGRLSNSLTLIFTFLSLRGIAPSFSPAAALLINIVNAMNLMVMVVCVALGFPSVLHFIKDFTGQITFHDTLLNVEGTCHQIVPHWDLDYEVQHRVWMSFWDGLLLHAYGGDVVRRLEHLKTLAQEKGLSRIRVHFESMRDPAVLACRNTLQTQLEGLDVYCDLPPHDGHLDSVTKFGKMYLQPFPFHAVLVYDDSPDYTFIHDPQQLQYLCDLNLRRGDIVAKVDVRRRIRALQGQVVHLPYSQVESHSVEDGTEHYTDSEGKQQTRTRHSTVQVEMYYEQGTLAVGNNDAANPWAAGFKPSISYHDGHGQARKPHTGEMARFHNMSTTIGPQVMGITDSFEWTPRLAELLQHHQNQALVSINMGPAVLAKAEEYRAGLVLKRVQAEQTLNSAFWYFIYRDHGADPSFVRSYFSTFEVNAALQALPQVHGEGLEYLFARTAYVRSHPAAAFWFVFFDDVWENNKCMKKIKVAEKDFNPAFPGSLAYRPMSRQALETVLGIAGVLGKRTYFTKALLDTLYQQLDKHMNSVPPPPSSDDNGNNGTAYVAASAPELTDRCYADTLSVT